METITLLPPAISTMTISKRETSPKIGTTTSEPRLLKRDVERDDIDAQIRALLTRRNALSDFCCLPTEVLAHIFSQLQLSEGRWYRVAHVCRHWRQNALHHPSLWTSIHLKFLEEAVEFIARSKSASLTIVIEDLSPSRQLRLSSRGIIDLLARHAFRISEIRVTSHIPDLNQFLGPVIKLPMPRLLNVSVTNSKGIILPLEIHNRSNLKGLALERCMITWECGNVFSLQKLSIRSLPESTKPTMSQLLVILSTCPQLEELNLTNAGPMSVDEDASTDGLYVSLSHLRRLVFAANVAICSKFLSRLRFPADIQWKIIVNIKRGQEHITFTPPASTNCKLLFVDLHSSSLDISYGQKSSIFEPTGRRAKLRVTWHEAFPTPFWVDVVESAFTLADRKTATDLHFRSNHSLSKNPSPIPVELWHRFFCFLPNLRALRFQNSYDLRSSDVEVSIAKVLGVPNDRLTSNGGMVCPNLQHAEFSHFNLSPERGDALEELKTFLEFRKTNRARLSKLTLRDCNGLSRDQIAPLKPLVGSVDWDGVEREDWSETDEDETDESLDEYYDEFYDHTYY